MVVYLKVHDIVDLGKLHDNLIKKLAIGSVWIIQVCSIDIHERLSYFTKHAQKEKQVLVETQINQSHFDLLRCRDRLSGAGVGGKDALIHISGKINLYSASFPYDEVSQSIVQGPLGVSKTVYRVNGV